MEPTQEISLYIKEGYDFGFLGSNQQFVVCGTLGGSALECPKKYGTQIVQFQSELTWVTSKNNVKKMKNFKVPIRLEFFKVTKEQKLQHPCFGYVIINLKSAQLVPPGEVFPLREEKLKVCGLGKEAAGSNPQITISLSIKNPDFSASDVQIEREDSVNPRIEIIPTPVLHPNTDEKVKNEILQQRNLDCELTGQSEDVINGDGLVVYHCFYLEITLVEIEWLSTFVSCHFRFHHPRSDITWTAHPDVESVIPETKNEVRNISAQLKFIEAPPYLSTLLERIPPIVTLCSKHNNLINVLAKGSIINLPQALEEVNGVVDLKELINMTVVGRLTYTAKIVDNGPQTFRQLSHELGDENFQDLVKAELDVWKTKERTQFETEYTNKFEAKIAEERAKLKQREEQLNNEMLEKVEECRLLSNELKETTNKIKQMQNECEAREQKFERQKCLLERNIERLFTDTKGQVSELKEQMKVKDDFISVLHKENVQLREKLEAENKRYGSSGQKEIEKLFSDLEVLQEKLDKEVNSKQFYKEQWGRAIRELHRIKSHDGIKTISVSLNYNTEELQRVGLSHLLGISDDLKKCHELNNTREDN